jgi:hypothetical protein
VAPTPVEVPPPAPVEALSAATVEEPEPEPEPVEDLSPARVEASIVAPVEAVALTPIEPVAPTPADAPQPAPVEAVSPQAVEAREPEPVEEVSPAPVEVSVDAPVEAPAAAPVDTPAPPLESVFADLRTQAIAEQPAPVTAAQYEVALHLLRDGRTDEAIAAFEVAAQAPELRFKAGSGLARLLKARGDLVKAIARFEDALLGDAPSLAARAATMYDLADALEQAGEPERAFTLFLDVDVDLPQFRDVSERLRRLKHALTARTT